MRSWCVWGSLTVALAAAPLAQSMMAPTNPDHRFVYNTYMNGLAEIKLGEFAQQKATASDVKQFGQRLVTDHGKANDELRMLAADKKITLPTTIDAKHQETYDRLSKVSGPAFDRAFMQEMVSAHRAAVSSFRTQSTGGKDQAIREWAAKTLPTIEAHLKQAESIHTAVGTTGTSPVKP